jgi:hypothetical protein
MDDESRQHVLIRRDPVSKAVSVWLTAPHDADTKNSITFSKKDGSRLDPKDVGRGLLYQAGAPQEMERLSEQETLEAFERLQARATAAAEAAAEAAAAAALRPAWGSASSSSTPVQTPKKEGPEFEGTWAGGIRAATIPSLPLLSTFHLRHTDPRHAPRPTSGAFARSRTHFCTLNYRPLPPQ